MGLIMCKFCHKCHGNKWKCEERKDAEAVPCPMCQRGQPCAANEQIINADLKARLADAEAVNARYEKALEHYADEANWHWHPDDLPSKAKFIWTGKREGPAIAYEALHPKQEEQAPSDYDFQKVRTEINRHIDDDSSVSNDEK